LIAEASFGGASDEQPYGIALKSDGHVVVGGVSISDDGDITTPLGGTDAWLFELDEDLQLVWQKNHGGSGGDHCRAVGFDPDNGMTIFGYSSSTDGDLVGSVGGTNFWLVNFEPFGVGLSEHYNDLSFTLHPNPTTNALRVELPSIAKGQLEVLDALGRMVHTQVLQQESTLQFVDVGALAPGSYTLRIRSGVQVAVRPWVKE
jgi:hypothetical protein